MELTEDQRRGLLDQAATAVNAWFACDPDARRNARKTAAVAVTAAVTKGHHIHTLISSRVTCSGLQVVQLIEDDEARTRAYAVEMNAVENYQRLVRAAAQTNAAVVVGAGEYGIKSRLAGWAGITRATLDSWLERVQERHKQDISYSIE